MIRFFRTLRQNPEAKNKISRYVLYALGEIALVVIGILIALKIDAEYSEAQQRKLEIKYLTEIHNNLVSDLNDIRFNIDFNEDRLQSHVYVLRYLNGEAPRTDSLRFHLGSLMGITRSIVNMSAFEHVKSRGLEIISNDSLRQDITELYTYEFNNVIDFETKDDHRVHYEILIPALVSRLNANGYLENSDAVPVNEAALLQDTEFKSILVLSLEFRKIMLTYYRDLQDHVNLVIELINAELKRL